MLPVMWRAPGPTSSAEGQGYNGPPPIHVNDFHTKIECDPAAIDASKLAHPKLSVAKTGTGDGTFSITPPGPTYEARTAVTVVAIPDTNSRFAGWSGDCRLVPTSP